MDTLKRYYNLIAGFALLNVLVIGGLAGVMYANGTLTLDRLKAAIEVFKPAQAADAVADGAVAADDAAEPVRSGTKPPTPTQRELARLNLERVTQAAEDRLRYANRMMVDIEREREALEQQEADAEKLRAEQAGMDADEVFQKDLEIVSLLKPKVALDNLLARPVDEAAYMMQSMDARTSKKIIESASKDPRKWAQMLQIQEKMRDAIDVNASQDGGQR